MMRMPPWLQKAWEKVLGSVWTIFGDVRSALVGGGVGALVAILMAAGPPRTYTVYPNADGVAMPLPTMLFMVNQEERGIEYKADPPNLEQVQVCEYANITGDTAKDVLEKYVDKYSMCFWIDQKADKKFAVRPNLRSGEIKQIRQTWYCKCHSLP